MSYKEFGNDMYALGTMAKRNLKLFFLDKAGVFFSLLAPLIVLVLYILFLRDVQIDSITAGFEGTPLDTKRVAAFIDSWMISGTVSIACLTVSLSACTTMVTDRTKGINKDGLASPVKNWSIKLSYFISNYVITVMICLIVLFIGFIYIAATGGWAVSVGEVFGLIGTVFFSALSATLLMCFIAYFIKTEAVMGAVVGIMSAMLGFLLGAYMPLSTFPKAIQIICGIIPGTHATGIFKNLFMTGALNSLTEGLPVEAVGEIKDTFGMNVNFFGANLGVGGMVAVVAVSIVIFFALNVLAVTVLSKKKVDDSPKRKLKRAKTK